MSDTHAQHELVEAIAVWTEDIRDLVSSSAGIIDAVMSAGQRPPRAIAEPVARLNASLRYQSLEASLRDFADDVAHPTCDFVVAALVIASRNQARDLSSLLTHLARCTRAECELYMRIWVSRARARTAVRIVIGAAVSFFAAMLMFSGGYLDPYTSLEGGVVATVIVAMFAVGAWWMARISTITLPDRFLTRRTGEMS